MDNKIDRLIQDALMSKTEDVAYSEGIFNKIQTEIEITEGKKAKKYKQFSQGFIYKKQFAIAASLFIVCSTLIFVSSNQARAFASAAIESIKTIFTLEKVGDELQIIEKTTNEARFTYAKQTGTKKSDEELSNKMGFKVSFPKTLGNYLKLESKSLGVSLNKYLDLETFENLKLGDTMDKAIEDDSHFARLKPYDPVWTVSGEYEGPDKSTIFINIHQVIDSYTMENQFEELKNTKGVDLKKLKLGDLDAYWVKSLYPKYPHTFENGVYKKDMSVKPELIEHYTLYWEKSGTRYILSSLIYTTNLTMEESIKLAEEFMKVN